LSVNTKYGYELCCAHNVWRRIADVKVDRMERTEREVENDGKKRMVVTETPVYVCLDGCPFLANVPLPPPNWPPARIWPRGHVPRSTPLLKKVNGSK
jgi:hypothetical protein